MLIKALILHADCFRQREDHCRSPGLEIFGLEVYALVVERCKAVVCIVAVLGSSIFFHFKFVLLTV